MEMLANIAPFISKVFMKTIGKRNFFYLPFAELTSIPLFKLYSNRYEERLEAVSLFLSPISSISPMFSNSIKCYSGDFYWYFNKIVR